MNTPCAEDLTAMLIDQLKPFSPDRFDACINHMMRTYRRTLDQHDVTKLHVMMEFFHVLATGKQMVGGRLKPWKHGPVLEDGYNRIRSLGHRFDETRTATHQGKLRVIGKSGNRYLYEAYGAIDEDDFSAAELEAMRRAWDVVIPLTFSQRESFFHDDQKYMGRAWTNARKAGLEGIDWNDVIRAYEAVTGEDHTEARLMVEAWRDDES
jgi:uncharacterized phage-associated protein